VSKGGPTRNPRARERGSRRLFNGKTPVVIPDSLNLYNTAKKKRSAIIYYRGPLEAGVHEGRNSTIPGKVFGKEKKKEKRRGVAPYALVGGER